jgi:DNA-binding cell septation regulator SpoVG
MRDSGYDVTITRMHTIEGAEGLRAFFDVNICDSILLRNMKLYSHRDYNMEVYPPSERGRDGSWYNQYIISDESLRSNIRERAIAHYEELLTGEQEGESGMESQEVSDRITAAVERGSLDRTNVFIDDIEIN